MWELYLLIGDSKKQKYLIDEIIETSKSLTEQNFRESMLLMYNNNPMVFDDALKMVILFTDGLKHNKFFEFQEFIRVINGRS